MVKIPAALLLLLLVPALCSEAIDAHVTPLDSSIWDNFLEANPKVFVYFYDQNLPDHRSIIFEFGKAALSLHENNMTEIRLAKVNAADNLDLAKRLGFEDFPVIVLFDEGEQVDYDQQPEAGNIVAWIDHFLKLPYERISTLEQLEELLKDHEVAKVLFYGDSQSQHFKTFARVAHLDQDNPYYLVDSKELIGEITTPTLRIYAYVHHPDAWATYSGNWSRQDVESWIQDTSLPVIVPITERTIKFVFDDKSITLVLVYLEDGDTVLNLLEAHCKANKKFTCAMVTKNDQMFPYLTSFLGKPEQITKSELLLLNSKAKRFYRYKGKVADITEELFSKWIDDWRNKRLKPDNLMNQGGQEHQQEPDDTVKDDEGKCSSSDADQNQAEL